MEFNERLWFRRAFFYDMGEEQLELLAFMQIHCQTL
jgi:hypothetical protein